MTFRFELTDHDALEHVRQNRDAHIVSLRTSEDAVRVEAILASLGSICYKKEILLTRDGYLNLIKLSSGAFGSSDVVIRAQASYRAGKDSPCVYVFACNDAEKIAQAKRELLDLCADDEFAIRVSLTREETIWLAESYFNENSLAILNHRPATFDDPRFDGLVDELRSLVKLRGGDIASVCAAGSTVLNVLGLRSCTDFDYFSEDATLQFWHEKLSLEDPDKQWYYPVPQKKIVEDPANHFYYRGVKFATPKLVGEMKRRRQSGEKDRRDVQLLQGLFCPTPIDRMRIGRALETFCGFVCRKRREGDRRSVKLFGLIRFMYRRRSESGVGGDRPLRCLVIAHVYYPEHWQDLAQRIRNISDSNDLIVTYSSEDHVKQARTDFPNARFLKCENVGYDIWPFLSALKGVDLSSYDCVVKLHTKRDLPEGLGARPFNGLLVDGSRWRNRLLAFLETPKAWTCTHDRLLDPHVGMVADRWVIARHSGAPYVAGTMFAAKPEVLLHFQSAVYSIERFAQADDAHMGSFAHECEREFGRAVGVCGLDIVGFRGSAVGFWLHRCVLGFWSFVYRNKRDASGRRIVKVLKMPVYRSSKH